jgi:hypothetical protein
MFWRSFRVSRAIFNRLLEACIEEDPNFFVTKRLATGENGHDAHQKITAALRILAYGNSADAVDEYIRMGEASASQAFQKFCQAIVNRFEAKYLSAPSADRLREALEMNSRRGFPGMIGSIDCMHWKWKNCPVAWQGQFKGKEGSPTVILEAIAGPDLYFYHCFFGGPGTWNDLNVLDQSPS